MPKFNFDIPVKIAPDEAFEKIKKFLKSENDFKKFDPSVKCSFQDKDMKCLLTGKQFKAELVVENSADSKKGSQVQIQVEVPFALALFKGKIKDAIEKNIKKVLS